MTRDKKILVTQEVKNSMWRYLSFRYYDPYFKTGLNRALMESVRGTGKPVAFLSGWERDCVNIGYGQKIEEEIDRKEVEKRGIAIVRRQGGGGTTYLTRDGEITWGIVAPSEKFSEDVNAVYQDVCEKICSGVKKIGIDAEHEPVNDVVTENGKISGATLKKSDGVTYIGGTLIYRTDPEEMFRILTPGREKIADKDIQDYKERVTSVKKESEADFDETVEALRKGLMKGKKFFEDDLSQEERRRAEELADKYSSEEWLYRNED